MSTSASTETSEARELSLVGKVELRIALTDSDVKLESILKTYLAPLLLKLTSEHMSVRNKVSNLSCRGCASSTCSHTVFIMLFSALGGLEDGQRPLIGVRISRSSPFANTSIPESNHRMHQPPVTLT